MAFQLYFDKCDPHVEEHMIVTGISAKGETMFDTRKVITDQKPYTMSGLARAAGLSRQGLINYKNRDEFLDTVIGLQLQDGNREEHKPRVHVSEAQSITTENVIELKLSR